MRNTSRMAAKAVGHKVTPTPEGFEVVSGTSGAKYLVAPLATGGAACTCRWAKRSSRIASACSHVLAVYAFAGEVLGRQASAWPSLEEARTHGAPQDIRDGVVLAVRPATDRVAA